MKIKDGFVVRKIANEWVAVPVGTRTAEFSGLVALSDTGRFLWELLKEEQTEEELVSALINEYDVDEPIARADVTEYLDTLKEKKLVVE